MHAYSQDLRDRVLGALERGERPSAIAKRFEVSRVWVYQVKARFLAGGERSSRPVGGYRVSRIAHLEATVRAWIKVQPDLTLAQLCERLAEHQGIQIKPPALWHQLDKWQLSFKKKTLHASEQERDDVKRARHEWQNAQSRWDPKAADDARETPTRSQPAPSTNPQSFDDLTQQELDELWLQRDELGYDDTQALWAARRRAYGVTPVTAEVRRACPTCMTVGDTCTCERGWW